MSVTIENGNPTPISMPDRWTARLNGKVFCSDASVVDVYVTPN